MFALPLLALALLQAPPAVRADTTIDARVRARVVDSLLARLADLYVFPEKVPALAKELRGRVASGRYDRLQTATAFSDTLSADLRALASDRHLTVRYSSRVLPTRRPGAAPAAERRPSAVEVRRAREEARDDNFGLGRVEVTEDGIGIIEVKSFGWEPEAVEEAYADAMNRVAKARVLVIDVRANGGGTPNAVALLSSYLFGPEPVHLNSLHWRVGKDRERVDSFWTRREVKGARFGPEKPVVVLTSGRTFSAAEEFAYNLQSRRRAIIIGESTRGGANPGQAERLDDHFYAFVPTGRAVNPVTRSNWEGTGVRPTLVVAADRALEDALEFIRTPQ